MKYINYIIFAFFLGVTVYSYAVGNTPEVTLDEFIIALKNHDTEGVINLIDTSMIEEEYKKSVEAAFNKPHAGEDPIVTEAKQNMKEKLYENMKTQILENFKEKMKSQWDSNWEQIGEVKNCSYSDKQEINSESVSYLLSCEMNGKNKMDKFTLIETTEGWKISPTITPVQSFQSTATSGG